MSTRVTHHTIAAQALANLQISLGNTQRLSDRLSSGRLIQRPSDDPSGTVSALQIRADVRAQTQYSRNAGDAVGWLTQADSALMNGSAALRRAKDLVIQGSNTGANGPQARAALATEIRSIRDGLIQTSNTTYLNRPVFGGTTGQPHAFTRDGTGPVSTYTYHGEGSVDRTLAQGVSVRADTPGSGPFGDAVDSVFALLDRIAVNLETDTDALAADLDALAGYEDRFTNALADVGARMNRVEGLQQKANDAVLDLTHSLAGVENIDLPRTILDLQLQQVAYQAALGATAKVLQPTLMDFLR